MPNNLFGVKSIITADAFSVAKAASPRNDFVKNRIKKDSVFRSNK
jgi:hypothetical protein